jgi:hypothetical protein
MLEKSPVEEMSDLCGRETKNEELAGRALSSLPVRQQECLHLVYFVLNMKESERKLSALPFKERPQVQRSQCVSCCSTNLASSSQHRVMMSRMRLEGFRLRGYLANHQCIVSSFPKLANMSFPPSHIFSSEEQR